MRILTPALQSHVAQELTSLCQCVEIVRNDGVVIRLTDHDVDLVVNGETYHAGSTFNMSAIKSGSDLSVDNATVDLGVDGTRIAKADFQKDLLRRASFYLFSVNWANPTDGVIDIKRGWIGDATIRDQDWVTLNLRGLTQALQRNILNQYSPTCRADFGDVKCGMAITPLSVRRSGASYRTGDWVVVPDTSTLTIVPFPNSSFEAGTTASWSSSPNSVWAVSTGTVQPRNGSYILEAGDAPSAAQWLSQDMSATVAGMSSSLIDQGTYALTVTAAITSPVSNQTDTARTRVVFYNNAGVEIGSAASPWTATTYGVWEDVVAAGFVPPQTRSFRVYLEATKSIGRINVAFDEVNISFASTFSDRVYKSVRIPARSVEDRASVTNYRFVDDGLVSTSNPITGWANTFYRVVTTYGGLVPYDGAYFLVGGNDGSNTDFSIYSISQTVAVSPPASSIFEVNIARAHIDAEQRSTILVEFLDAAGAIISSLGNTFTATETLASWENLRVSGPLPPTAASARITLKGRTGTGSELRVAFDSVRAYILNTGAARAVDPKRGRTAQVQPMFDTAIGSFTYDGEIIWQCAEAPFSFDSVASVGSRRVFAGTAISGGDYAFFGARIVWLSGANAGSTSFVRTWVPGSKTIKLYAEAGSPIAPDDRFLYSLGCNKSISDCSNRFNNAINFRGEPFLPGTDKALTFFTTGV